MISPRRRHAAWRQAALLTLIVLVASIGVALYKQRPANEDELSIPIGELRSQGLELKLLSEHAARGRERRFVKAHARQVAQSIARARDELTSLQPTPQHAATRVAALRRSAPLLEAAAQLGAGRAPLDPATAAQVVASAEYLKSLEDGLRQ